MTTENNSGIVYILTNPAMPGMIKIGKTKGDVKDRMNSLYKTGIPLPFECHYAKQFDNYSEIEKNMHDIFSDKRINMNREFFDVEPERVVDALRFIPGKAIVGINGFDDNLDIYDVSAIEKVEKKSIRSKIKINKILNIGDIIYFSRDETITATVLEDNKILFKGEITTLSGSADKILNLGNKNYGVQGSIYWKFDGETLDERRRRMDND